MGVEFKDIVFVDNGIQQLGTAFLFSDSTLPGRYDVVFQTSVAAQTYVMIVVEITGVVSTGQAGFLDSGTSPVKQAWNFYTYSYDIGNVNNVRAAAPITLQSPYSSGGVIICRGLVNDKSSLGLLVDVYAVAGNGYRYPVQINNAYLTEV